MSVIAGLKDFRGQGVPADIGTFQLMGTAIVFQFTFSGVTYAVAIGAGVEGWTLIAQSVAGAEDVEINAAIAYVGPMGGGLIHVCNCPTGVTSYLLTAPINSQTYNDITLEGEGRNTVFYKMDMLQDNAIELYDATGWHITNLKIDGNRPNNPLLDPLQFALQHGILIGDSCYDNKLSHLWIENCRRYGVICCSRDAAGIDQTDSERTQIVQIHGYNNRRTIGLSSSNKNTITNCHSREVEESSFHCEGASQNTFTNCVSIDPGVSSFSTILASIGVIYDGCEAYHTVDAVAFMTLTGANGTIISNCHAEGTDSSQGKAVSLSDSTECVVAGCTFTSFEFLIQLRADTFSNVISGNVVSVSTRHGINVMNGSSDNTICNNTVRGVDRDGIRVEGVDTDDNFIIGNTLIDNGWYGVDITVNTCHDNWVINNRYSGNGNGPIQDLGTGTKLECITLYIATYNVTDVSESEDGLVVDDVGEWVSFVGQLPLHVQQVVRFEIWAVGLAAPGAGNQMCLEIEIEGGAEATQKDTHDTGALAGQLSVTEATAIDDIIHWVCTDANALALLGGDSVKCACRYNAAVASDIATNVAFRRVLAHIV